MRGGGEGGTLSPADDSVAFPTKRLMLAANSSANMLTANSGPRSNPGFCKRPTSAGGHYVYSAFPAPSAAF